MAVPLKMVDDMPAEELARNVVLDTNNYMAWRDVDFAIIHSGHRTEHELRHDHLPTPKWSRPSPTSKLPASPPRADRPVLPAAWR
ncbi:hypothetical protein [Rhodococcus spelaei]|uniref:hypothetical protein n=1 Tax=Rhodococcus spelaei TaxID=2546320 RepID=UPI0015EF778A|nr:hypothetical protein [Rhodococcus spelaei]